MECAAHSAHEAALALRRGRATTLSASDSGLGDLGAERVAVELACNRSVQTLRLSDNDIRDGGARTLAEALLENSALTALSLNRNGIGPEGAHSLAAALSDGGGPLTDLSATTPWGTWERRTWRRPCGAAPRLRPLTCASTASATLARGPSRRRWR
ncbi:unnamed protein product [Prorocentrum cordatum]|uniref:Uncharacterized protein n=1 Tax=Prorocentrum cordatum TaxID=2364126 RepID=A0ABN9TK79_9DINO|nr:unnamed protein product [Polarella glacialis]